MSFGSNSLNLWKFHVDWTTPANTTFTGPTSLPVASFAAACNGGTCIPQLGTSQQLDSLGDRLMYRLAYRNFGDHESLVVNHSVTAGSSVGVRWYEIRNPNGAVTVFQQGTYAPDSSYRWMGSIAMDHNGNIGLGFSISSGSRHPGIHYTGRLTTDPLGFMGQGEAVLFDGAGSQLSNLNRWGDYSTMTVDPTDDCTFWYANQYLQADGTFNWSTRIGSFKFPGCGSPDFSVTASPASQSVVQGGSTSYTVTVTPSGGFTGVVSLSVSGLPSGASGTFNPASLSSGNSTLSVATAASTPAGTYPLTITGTGPGGTPVHSTSVTLVVSAPAQPDFALSVSPSSQNVRQGLSASYTVTITPSAGFASAVNLSVSGLPSGATASFNPNPATGSSTLTVNTVTGVRGSFVLTITGVSGSLTHSTTATLNVTKR